MKNKIQFLIFNIIITIGGSSLLISNMLMRLYPKNSYLVYLITLPIILFGFIFNKYINKSIKTILSSNILRYTLILYLIISSFLFTLSYLKITNDYFYQLTSPLIIIIIIYLVSIYLSSYGIKSIINIGVILFVIVFFISLITILNKTKFDIKLLSFSNINIDKPYQLIGILFIYFDVVIINLFSYTRYTKSKYLICSLLSVLISVFLILENYLVFDSNYFIDGKFPYINKYLVYTNNRYFEHFDLIYLIFITVYLLVRLALNIEIFRIANKLKRNNYTIFIFPVIIIGGIYLTSFLLVDIIIINYITIISSLLLIAFLILYNILIRKKANE